MVLTINGGSSSIKFALFKAGDLPERIAGGTLERVEESDPVDALIEQLIAREEFKEVVGIGHRVVHGMTHSQPERVTPGLIDDLKKIAPFDPDHMPREIQLIEAFQTRFPKIGQVACFDTAFHRTMPRVAKLLPLPRRFDAKGVQRYGFHGISYAYLMEELNRLGDPAATNGRVILAHLGNGASMAAVRDGRSIDTTMSFTPTAGLVMGTRTGDIDPGLVAYLAESEGISADRFQQMVNRESGLLGVSETSSDMRDLLNCEPRDVRASEAVELFCYQAKKWIGALTAALGGLDALVFAGGIGENAPPVRERICAGLEFLGLEIDEGKNTANESLISAAGSRITVRVIKTDEESMIARSVFRLLRDH